MACVASNFTPLGDEAREKQFFSPETRFRYENRVTHRNATISEYVAAGAAKCAHPDARKYAPTLVRVTLHGRTEHFEVAAVKGWHDALKRSIEERFGVRCERLEHGGKALGACKIFELAGAPAAVDVVGVQRGAAASSQPIDWPAFRRRVVVRVCRALPRALARIEPGDGETRAEAARKMVFTRARIEPFMRALVRDPTLAASYDGDGDGDNDGEAAWVGSELADAHADASVVARAHARFVDAHAIDDAAVNEMASRLAAEALAAIGAQLDGVAPGTTCAPDEAFLRAALQEHFDQAAIGGGFVLSADRCNCGARAAQKTAPAPAQRARRSNAAEETLNDVGLALGDALPPPLERAPIASEMPPLVPLASEMPPLVPLASEMPPLVPLASEMPPLVPISSEMPPLVPISSELPPLVPISSELPSLEPIADELPPLEPIAGDAFPAPIGTMVHEKRHKRAGESRHRRKHEHEHEHEHERSHLPDSIYVSAESIGAPLESIDDSISNFAPFLERYAAKRSYDNFVALAPTNAAFTDARAAAFAALSDSQLDAAMAPYVASDPEAEPAPGAPVTLHMFSGAQHTLTDDGRVSGVARPFVLGTQRVGENVRVYAHQNLLA
jgi:hypothetical protein